MDEIIQKIAKRLDSEDFNVRKNASETILFIVSSGNEGLK